MDLAGSRLNWCAAPKSRSPRQDRQLSMRVGMRTMYQLQAQLDKQEMAQPWVTKEAVRVPFGNGVDEITRKVSRRPKLISKGPSRHIEDDSDEKSNQIRKKYCPQVARNFTPE